MHCQFTSQEYAVGHSHNVMAVDILDGLDRGAVSRRIKEASLV